MAKYIDTPVVDTEKVSRAISRLLRMEIERRGLQMKEVQKKTNLSQSGFSQVLGSQPSKNLIVYKSIAHAIGLTDNQFDSIVDQAKKEIFGGGPQNFDYALSSKLGNNPDAIKEAEGFLDFVKNKYGIK